MSRHLPIIIILFLALAALGQNLPPAGKIILVPIDDRPAVAQFAQMIGAIADHEVLLPPYEILGRFTAPGDPERIRRWLEEQDYSKINALIVSVDMLAYGGLVASRVHNLPVEKALERMEFFRWFKKKHPRIPTYAFNAIMRVAPTADAASRPWRDRLARWAELKGRVSGIGDENLAAELARLEKELDPSLLEDYQAARRRNLRVSLAAIDLVKEGTIGSLILLQDDARVHGLHRQDQEVLNRRLRELNLVNAIPIYNGADEGSLSLVSRAIVEKYHHPPSIEVVYSSPKSREIIAPYEDHPLQYTVESQIRSAGARVAPSAETADYKLYVNAPQTSESEFEAFAANLLSDLKDGKRVALADVLFPPPHYSGADERLIRALEKEKLFDKFTGCAAWNTAGNTLGTTIPQANMRVLFQAKLTNAAGRSAKAMAAHLEFLMHRFVGDYIYHDIVRFDINRKLREAPSDPTDEFTPEMYTRINRLTEDELRPRIEDFFAKYFQGRTYSVRGYNSSRVMMLNALRGLKIRLPWPRTFEVAIEYKIEYGVK